MGGAARPRGPEHGPSAGRRPHDLDRVPPWDHLVDRCTKASAQLDVGAARQPRVDADVQRVTPASADLHPGDDISSDGGQGAGDRLTDQVGCLGLYHRLLPRRHSRIVAARPSRR